VKLKAVQTGGESSIGSERETAQEPAAKVRLINAEGDKR